MTTIPGQVQVLADERVRARANKDFARSDQLREEIAGSGWLIKDTTEGYVLLEAPPFVIAPNLGAFIDQYADSVSGTTAVLVIVDGWPVDVRSCLSALLQYVPSDVRILTIDCGNVDGAGVVVHELAKIHQNLIDIHFTQTLSELGWANVVNAAAAVVSSDFFAVMDVSTIWEGDALTPLLPSSRILKLRSQAGAVLTLTLNKSGANSSRPRREA